MITIGLWIFLLTLVTDLATDVWRKRTGRKVNHTRGAILRLIGLSPAGVCLIMPGPYIAWILVPPVAVGVFCWYWVLFDGLYNLLTREPWGRIGETGWLDQKQRKYPWLVQAKYVGAVISVLAYLPSIYI